MRKLFALLPALLILTGCAASSVSTNMTESEIHTTLETLVSNIPKSDSKEINLALRPSTDGELTEYSASFDITWEAEVGRFSTEKALDKYSRELAVSIMDNTPSVTALDIDWMVPYHSQNEVSMSYAFERKRDTIWQTSLYDRFTDGSFGADAFLEEPIIPVSAAVKIDSSIIAALTPEATSRLKNSLPTTAEQAEIMISRPQDITQVSYSPFNAVQPLSDTTQQPPEPKQNTRQTQRAQQEQTEESGQSATTPIPQQNLSENSSTQTTNALPSNSTPQDKKTLDSIPDLTERKNSTNSAPTSDVNENVIVYVSNSGNKIHKIPNCSNMKYYKEMTRSEANANGYEYCKNCW